MFDILAVLGRGIQCLDPGSDPTDAASWVSTEDLEVCDKDSAHLSVRVPADDANPYCMIGGGEMNLEAGQILIRRYRPRFVVCAYGGRSDYLKSVGGPSESEVMSKELAKLLATNALHLTRIRSVRDFRLSEIVVWPRERELPVPSNTGQEIRNIFDLALEHRITTVGIVTIGVHIPRAMIYVAKYLSRHGVYKGLSVQVFESEEVLVTADPRNWPRVEALRNSQAFARNWAREADGVRKIIRDVFKDAKPPVVA